MARLTQPRIECARMRCLIVTALLCAVALLHAGCNYAGPILYAIQPEPTIEAQFQLEDRPTVVFVDDRDGVLIPATLADVIADHASEELMIHEVVTTAIRPRDAMALARSRDRHNNLMSIDAIGEAVGAEQIIYVQMETFAESRDRYTPQPVAAARIKVLDVVNDERIFPTGDETIDFILVQTNLGDIDRDLYKSASTRRQIREMLAKALGDDIAKVFYEHKPSDMLGERLEPR